MKVFLYGRDNVGWSVDADREYMSRFLPDIGHRLTGNPLIANVVHCVWWNLLLGYRALPLRWKKIIAVATNEIDVNSPQFKRAKKFVTLWVAPSRSMCERLKAAGVDVQYQPLYTDEHEFTKLPQGRETIARELGLDPSQLVGKLVIGSFQRDSLGDDLTKPKWQKGPELLVEILAELPRDRIVLLLAGPRRHWIMGKCRELKIPYVYCGKEPQRLEDDLLVNTLDRPTINKLYNLTDLYVVSSRSEGGPKAILESIFSRTMIISTFVGQAPDFLDKRCLFRTRDEALEKINRMLAGQDLSPIIDSNYNKAYGIASYVPMRDRWKEIYEYFRKTYLS